MENGKLPNEGEWKHPKTLMIQCNSRDEMDELVVFANMLKRKFTTTTKDDEADEDEKAASIVKRRIHDRDIACKEHVSKFEEFYNENGRMCRIPST
jgi:hypothetical protein